MNYDLCRKNLVDCQLYTNGILDKDILNIFRHLPREKFYGQNCAAACYGDEDINLHNGYWALEPLTEARIVYYGGFKKSDVVLVIGASTPTLPAYLAHLVTTVIVIDSNEDLLKTIRDAALDLELCNIVTEKVDHCSQGYAKQAPYDKIVFAGAIPHIPEVISSQILDGGTIAAITRDNENCPGSLNIYEKLDNGALSARYIGTANTPFLKSFEPEEKFEF